MRSDRQILIFAVLTSFAFSSAEADEPVISLKLAFVSNREHYWYPHVYLYEHDGKSFGKIAGSIDPKDKRLDHQPALAADGKFCVFGSEEEAQVGRLQFWDLPTNAARNVGDLFKTPNAVFSPSLSSDGRWLALSAWNRPGTSTRWDILLYDLAKKQPVELPGLNTPKFDERRAAISGDGRWLAYTTNAPDGKGLTDVRLFDRETGQIDVLAELNSSASDSYPALSGDGGLVCFASDRQGGMGGLDVYLFDRIARQFVSVSGLNSPGHEQTPSITSDGRFIAFVTERFGAPGEHDIFLYDRQRAHFLDTPGLNTDRDDYDPCLILVNK